MFLNSIRHSFSPTRRPGTIRREHPWDIEPGGDKRVLGIALIALFCLFAWLPAAAQEDSESPESAEELKKKLIEIKIEAEQVSRRSAELKRQQQELKEELIRALRDQAETSEDLRKLLVDYQEYFASEQSPTSERTIRELSGLAEALKKGAYIQDYRTLSKDLTELQEELRRAENEFRTAENQERAARLSRSLQREIEIYQDLLPSQGDMRILIAELAEEMAQVSTEVSQRVIMSIVRDREASDLIDITIDPKDSSQFVIRLPKLVEEPVVVRPPSAALPPVTSPAPSIDFATPDRRIITSTSGQITLVHRLADSVRLSGDLPVELTVPIGRVDVQGIDGDWLRVTTTIEMQSDKRRLLEKLGDEIRLMLNEGSDRVVAQAILPNLRSSDTRVSEARTVVQIPRDCELIASTSFGPVTVIDLADDVFITGHHSIISVERIDADVSINNRMGAISVSHVTGEARISNHCGIVSVSNVEDDIHITNAQAPVTVANCEGDLEIHSDGPIDVSFHIGDILVRNSTGPVTFSRIEGDIDAATSFGPASATNVIGDVRLVTVSAPLMASNIDGALTASNRAALMSVLGVNGALNLSNNGGSIMLTMAENPAGPSSISTTYGDVQLTLPRDADLTVASRLIRGNITTSLPMQVREEGNVRIATISLGNGRGELNIDATNSTVEMSQAY